jgi:oligoendopeptidase F
MTTQLNWTPGSKSLLAGLMMSASIFVAACEPQAGTTDNTANDEPASTDTATTGDATPDAGTPEAAEEEARVVDEKYIWNLTDLYATPEAWSAARETVLADIEKLNDLKGTLGESAQSLLASTDQISAVSKEALRLLVYATLKADEDTRISENEERRQLAQNLLNDLGSATSWYSPEILAIGEDTIRGYLDSEPGLAKHRFDLENTLRRAPHTLSAEAEQIMAATSPLTGAPNNVYNILANSDLPWEELTLSTGETVTLSQAGYSRYRQAPNRDDRQNVFDTFWGTWKKYENTLGTLMNSHVQGLKFQTDQRNHETSVGRALFDDNMPEAVYRTLVSEVNEALPTLHRYFKLRKRMLKLEGDMRYFDIYPPLVNLDKKFGIEESITITREALEPLGEEYMAGYDAGIEGRWMHVYPQPGKRSGAYMFGSAYDVHPYVLLNHNDDYDSASTFAHEYGHAVHSVLSNKTQPFETAGYATFIAETASIMNEMLLQDVMVEKAQTPQERLFYLGSGLESLRGTYFRQTMFAEFELKMNDEVKAGNVLTGAKLTEIYLDLLKRYHGHEEGVVKIDDLYGIEWAYIPHFYYDFYVFQYATSIAAATYLAEQIGNGSEEARDAFINMLKAGGSDYAYNLMKEAGLDMATPAPYRALATRMNSIMDQMEAILDEMEAEPAPAE